MVAILKLKTAARCFHSYKSNTQLSEKLFACFPSKEMGENKRKRGRKPKIPDDEIMVEEEYTNNATTGASDPSSPGSSRRRPGRKIKSKDKSQPNILALPERRSSRLAQQNGYCAPMNLVDESPLMLQCENVVKVFPSMDAVVKVFCVHFDPNFLLPWQRKRQYSSSSSGFIIEGRRVLTNAHSVEHHTQVKLKKHGSDTKYLATVLAIGTECDIGGSLFGCLYFLNKKTKSLARASSIGFPILGVKWQKMENPDLQMSMEMEPDQKGVRIRRIEPTAPESIVLKPYDVILSFDSVNIANDGTAHKRLIPAHIKGRPPSYYIIARFIFTAVSVPYLRYEVLPLPSTGIYRESHTATSSKLFKAIPCRLS